MDKLLHMAEQKRLPPIDAELKERFKKDVIDRKGTPHGHLKTETERAIREYLNASQGGDTHDRLERIEKAVAEMQDTLANLDSDGRTDSVSKRTENRISEIMADIQAEAERLDSKRVSERIVESAIENNAGTSYKTLQRYKDLLQNQRELFPAPTEDGVYYVDRTAFTVYVENTVESRRANEIAETYGWDWWEESLPTDFHTETIEPGVQ